MQNFRMKKGNTYISILASKYYFKDLLSVLRNVKNKNICYVAMNKTAQSLEKAFKAHKIAHNNILFIDTVSNGLNMKNENSSTIFVSSPRALTELSIAISEVQKTGKFDAIIFDSISTLLQYNTKKTGAGRFLASIIRKTKSAGQLGVFTCLDCDEKESLVQQSYMYVDGVITLAKKHSTARQWKQIASAVLVLGAGVTLFLGGNSNPSGFFSSVPAAPAFIPSVAVFILVASFIIYLVTAKRNVTIVNPQDLGRIKASKESTRKLRQTFKSKIARWLKRR